MVDLKHSILAAIFIDDIINQRINDLLTLFFFFFSFFISFLFFHCFSGLFLYRFFRILILAHDFRSIGKCRYTIIDRIIALIGIVT